MFREAFQSGFLSILYSVGSSPLAIWGRQVKNGHIKRLCDEDVKSLVLEVAGSNVATTYIYCPADPKMSLGVRLNFLVMIIKNLHKYFSFEITVLDNTFTRRRLRASNYQSTTKVRQFNCSMPMGLNPGWNQVQFNLADFTRRAYGTYYVETVRIQIHANCRIRRVYFADRLYSEDDVPPEYRLLAEDRRRSDFGAGMPVKTGTPGMTGPPSTPGPPGTPGPVGITAAPNAAGMSKAAGMIAMTSAALTAAMQCPDGPPPGECAGDRARPAAKPNT